MNQHLNLILRYPHVEYKTPEGSMFIESFYLQPEPEVSFESYGNWYTFKPNEVKPILKPLNSLTEEQKEQLCRLVTQNSALAATFIEGNFVIYKIDGGDYYFEYEPSKYPTCVARQLEVWGICYEPELVEQGLAIIEQP